jgi:hypothetical protein
MSKTTNRNPDEDVRVWCRRSTKDRLNRLKLYSDTWDDLLVELAELAEQHDDEI